MKKAVIFFLCFAILFCSACGNSTAKVKLKELDEYVYEVETYQQLDYDYANEYYMTTYDNWGGGCSAISKMVNNHRLVGRNMDLNISNKCAYIIRTNSEKHKTVGLAYTFRDISPDREEVQKNGITKQFYKLLPFMCDDVLNDAGLHIEINMRHGECWPNGDDKFGCEGTNPDSSERVYLFALPRYIGENCSSVEEAKKYVASLNVYSQYQYWNYCFLVSDAVGNSSLLEFSENKVHWLDEDKISSYTWLEKYNLKAIGQANFYLNKSAWEKQDIKSGEGRFATLQNGIDAVQSRSDMYELMKKVQFSSIYLKYDDCKSNRFDPRSEYIGEFPGATYDALMDPKLEQVYKTRLDEIASEISAMTRQEKQDKNEYWESTFTEVVDTNSKAIFVRMFENEDLLYLINIDGTKKLNSISEWTD